MKSLWIATVTVLLIALLAFVLFFSPVAILWVKTFHILFMASWFAGLFYLPRIYVNLAQATDPAVKQTLIGMSHRLYRFMTILAFPAVGFGLWLYLYYGIGMGAGNGWMHVKLILVGLIIVYHLVCKHYLTLFEQGTNPHSHVFYRWFNEIPVVLMLAIIAMVVLKPF
ncbi:CopD family protein [Orrella daihaiensis]|uniref:Protoporphyrinogen IX oxidase n=1 Tax=Orrella daihaiensis TaxID=2782176 RepID=A0ABY4AGY7_9BURK|nr:CopD family protein [Orrella daihaiensis]